MKTKSTRKLGIAGLVLAGMSLVGCKFPTDVTPQPSPTPRPDYFTNITFEVIGNNVAGSSVSYGNLLYADCNDSTKKRWICPSVTGCVSDEVPCSGSINNFPWSYTYSTCKGHGVKLGAVSMGNPDGSLILRIKQDGNVVAQTQYDSNGVVWGGSLEYNIPGP
ncbi:MAG: hypothetical protein M1416_02260 [Candidatus Pacearchaeota archaeon]|nr:hypothetical protein [Candidatus Pacearchaeota archaeon]